MLSGLDQLQHSVASVCVCLCVCACVCVCVCVRVCALVGLLLREWWAACSSPRPTGDAEQADWLESHAASLAEVAGLLAGGEALAKHGLDTCVAELKEADTQRARGLIRTLLARAERWEFGAVGESWRACARPAWLSRCIGAVMEGQGSARARGMAHMRLGSPGVAL